MDAASHNQQLHPFTPSPTLNRRAQQNHKMFSQTLLLTTFLSLFTTSTLSSPVPVPVPDPMPVPQPQATSLPTPTQLQPGAYWIRAVVAPNYHKYLQTKPANVPGAVALLESHTTAGQFNIVEGEGQLVNKVSSPPLYMWVEEPADKANPPRTLATWFNTTKNPFGSFAWQGDTLTWSVSSVKRQNVAAWLVCKGQQLFVNTGAYGYQTPQGCADQTVSLSSLFYFLFFFCFLCVFFSFSSLGNDGERRGGGWWWWRW